MKMEIPSGPMNLNKSLSVTRTATVNNGPMRPVDIQIRKLKELDQGVFSVLGAKSREYG